MTHCPIHGMQASLQVSPDIAHRLYKGGLHMRVCRIDIYVDGVCCFTHFISNEYCLHVGLDPLKDEVSYLVDETAFTEKLEWKPEVVPYCGICFANNYPLALSLPAPTPPSNMIHGYILRVVDTSRENQS